jgi:type IV pilus assembly protein PilN
MQIGTQITVQKDRNEFLDTETKLLDRKITEIRTLREERQALIDRMEVIQNLQTDRPITVYLFDSLARLIPEDVYLSSMAKDGNRLSLRGVGKTNISVTDFMRALDESEYFSNPRISGFSSVDIDPNTGSSGYQFTIDVQQITPNADLEEEE